VKSQDPVKTKGHFLLKPNLLLILFSAVSGFFNQTFSQSTNIFGVVNTYFQVIDIIPSKACVRVSDPTGLILNNRVMLVQMKGATINTSTGSSFGDVTLMNEAGNYEIGTICYIIGDSVFLFHELLNTYNYSTGKVQLVQFAEYYTAVVTDTVKAAPWDSVSGTGGVIAIFCDQDLTLSAPVYADSSGFRGGNHLLHSGNCLNFAPSNLYVYDPTSTGDFQGGAYKGESITNLTTPLSGGRGAPANGGGGGNNHNNSGGGGANLNTGGRGGGNASTTGCTTTLRGESGKALNSSGGQKIFLGGGGGAGNANYSGSVSKGGNGGGIVFIWALNLNGNNKTISANGGAGGNSISDGAGGGGAGGTIIMHVTNYVGNVNIYANGGKGGDSDDAGNPGRCYGGGGGGSGGVIYFTGSSAGTVSVNGGIAGIEFSSVSCGVLQPALPGSNGQTISSYNYSTSTDPAGYCALLLPVQLEYFYASQISKKVKLQWKILNPADVIEVIIERSSDNNQWSEWNRINVDDQTFVYSTWDAQPLPGKIFYRLRFIEQNHSTSYSPIRWVNIDPEGSFLVYPNPATDKIVIISKDILPAELKLMDLSGRMIMRTNIVQSSAEISVSTLPKGTYLLDLNGKIKKLVIY
jgi:hypothetical protein